MDDVLGYRGKRCVVTGAASGMGAATAELLGQLDAEVIALDVQEVTAPVAQVITVDLRDGDSIAAAAGAIEGPIDAFFNVAGLPGPPFSDLDVMVVNFVGGRDLIERVVPQMPEGSAIAYVASAGGIGWQDNLDKYLPLFATTSFAEGKAWLEANEEVWSWSGYAASKQAINAWTAWRSATLLADHRIRLNCTNPGPTSTAMMPYFHEANGKALVDMAVAGLGRYSTAEEQAWPLIFLNSPRSSFVAGDSCFTDAGFFAALVTGQVDFSALTEAGS